MSRSVFESAENILGNEKMLLKRLSAMSCLKEKSVI